MAVPLNNSYVGLINKRMSQGGSQQYVRIKHYPVVGAGEEDRRRHCCPQARAGVSMNASQSQLSDYSSKNKKYDKFIGFRSLASRRASMPTAGGEGMGEGESPGVSRVHTSSAITTARSRLVNDNREDVQTP